MYEITVTRTLRASHALRMPDGSLEPRHEHNWQIFVTVGARRLNPTGLVMDFHRLERLVESVLSLAQDRCLNDLPPFAPSGRRPPLNPTAEHLAWWIAQQIQKKLPTRTRLLSVAVTESPGCIATFRP